MTQGAETDQASTAGRGGFSRVIAATVVGGVAGYVITWLVPRMLGFGAYAEFAVFWGFLFLAVSALSGVQQEVTRATRPATVGGKTPAIAFGAAVGGVVLVALVATAPLWVEGVFPSSGLGLVWPVAVGTASYVGVAVVGGTLYGLSQWGPVFWLISTEAVLRLLAVGVVLAFTTDVVAIAWAVALPFPATLIMLARYLFRRISGRAELDVGQGQLTWNVVRTIVAAGSMGVLISGMPMLLGITAGDEPQVVLGMVIITMTLTRAPLIVVVMALQSYFIVMFKGAGVRFWKVYLTLSGVIVLGGLVLAALGYLGGPWVFSVLFPGETVPEAALVAAMVMSSALVGLLCLSAPAVLVRSQHFVYSAGWLVAALVTVGALALPVGFMDRTMMALILGPVAGLLVHCTYLVAVARSDGRDAQAGSSAAAS